ncbi:MAG: DUF4184 family protein [Gammaproteobacteria bacterium]|nr:DUF4184 family protein [Gammaproteobacteria bacterium]
MPYTLSHTAAVLPFSRVLERYRMLSAAVVGSMVPDFGYLLPGGLPRFETHSAAALLDFCLPAGLATYWLFQWLIKRPVWEILPDDAHYRTRGHSAPARLADWRQWAAAITGVIGGAITHLAWDGFTHEGARGVRMIPALNDDVADVAGHHLLIYKLLQQGSSLFGLAVLAWVLWRALSLRSPHAGGTRALAAGERQRWFGAYAATAMLASFAALLVEPLAGHGPMAIVGGLAIAALRGLAIAVIAVSAALRVRLFVGDRSRR